MNAGKTCAIAALFAVQAFMSFGAAYAADDRQTFVRMREDASPEFSTYTTYVTLPHQKIQSMYPDSSNAEAFKKLVMDGAFIGNGGQKWTRGMDIIGHYEYNFVDMAAYRQWRHDNPAAAAYDDGCWMDWNSASLDLKKKLATTFKGGDFAGQDIIGHGHAIAASHINLVVLYNDEGAGSLNLYNYASGAFYEKTSWTSMHGGIYNGMSLSETIGSLIGIDSFNSIDDQKLYFLDGDSTIAVYDLEGRFVDTYSITLEAYPELSGHTLGDIVDGEVRGWSYIGWDHGPTFVNIDGIVIPEASVATAVSGLIALALAAWMRRTER